MEIVLGIILGFVSAAWWNMRGHNVHWVRQHRDPETGEWVTR